MQFRKHCLAAAAIASLLPFAASGSSHREAPNIAGMPNVDSTDFYLFNSYEPDRAGYVVSACFATMSTTAPTGASVASAPQAPHCLDSR